MNDTRRPVGCPVLVQLRISPATDPAFRPDMKSLAKEELKKFTGGDAVGQATGLRKGILGGKKK
jgi:hypothetical protein